MVHRPWCGNHTDIRIQPVNIEITTIIIKRNETVVYIGIFLLTKGKLLLNYKILDPVILKTIYYVVFEISGLWKGFLSFGQYIDLITKIKV